MKSIIFFIVILFCLTFLNSCRKDVHLKADFSFQIIKGGILPTTVKFTSTSINAISYQWSFDDGNYSNLSNPANVYSSAKTYSVKLVVSSSGGKDSITKQVTITDTVKRNIYIVGIEQNSAGYNIAKYWKNGVATNLSNGKSNATAVDIFVSGKDVYVCGSEEVAGVPVAEYWKNGAATILSDGKTAAWASSITVSNGDVYVSGTQYSIYGKTVAKYWKNGNPIALTNGTWNAGASSIAISGTDIYVAGYESNKSGVPVDTPMVKYWKNGTPFILYNGTKRTDVLNLSISGNDLYVCWQEHPSNDGSIDAVKYWKNGIITSMPITGIIFPGAAQMVVAGNDVYIVESDFPSSSNQGTYAIKYWKNGTLYNVTDGSKEAFGYSIFIDGNDIYIGGSEYNPISDKHQAKYWKNGISTALTDGLNYSQVSKIYVEIP